MTIFLASLAGVPPLGGWFGKFAAFRAVLDTGEGWAYALAIIGAVNTAIAAGVLHHRDARDLDEARPDGDTTEIRTPNAVQGRTGDHVRGDDRARRAPRLVSRYGDLSDLTGARGR
jgi:NADH-quinone oxidoreductase subunit N